MIEASRRFLVALSFPGEHRQFVEAVARCVSGELGEERVLYDRFHEAEFARPNLDTHLQGLYHDESALVVVFLCAEYERKEWPGLEWRAIRDLIKKRRAESIMLIRLDDANISGIFSIDGYISIEDRVPIDIASLILERLRILKAYPKEATESSLVRASFGEDVSVSALLRSAIQLAYEVAIQEGHGFLGVPHLLVGLFEIEGSRLAGLVASTTIPGATGRFRIFQHLRNLGESQQPESMNVAVTDAWRDTLRLALDHSRRRLREFVDEDDVLLAALETRPFLLESLGISIEELKKTLLAPVDTPYRDR
jgi:hypothetical protein